MLKSKWLTIFLNRPKQNIRVQTWNVVHLVRLLFPVTGVLPLCRFQDGETVGRQFPKRSL